MLFSPVFAANHLRSISSFAPLCDLLDRCVEIPTPFDSDSCSCAGILPKNTQNRLFKIRDLRTLSFSVSCKPCVCHSSANFASRKVLRDEICPGVYSTIPILEPISQSSHSHYTSSSFFSHSCALFGTAKNSTLLFSSNSALFTQKHPGVGVPLSSKNRQEPRLGYTLLSGGSLGSRQKYPAWTAAPKSRKK